MPHPTFDEEPLIQLCQGRGWPTPELQPIASDALPDDVSPFFDHQRSMTSRLEGLFGGAIHVEVLAVQHTEAFYRRLVLLHCEGESRPLLLGCTDAYLDRFDQPVRHEIERAQKPFGKVLADMTVAHDYRPVSFFAMNVFPQISTLLESDADATLYGRSKRVYGADNRLLAVVTEIPARYRLPIHIRSA